MVRELGSQNKANTLDRAVDDVFGRPPAWPWSVVAWIAGGGVAGALAASLFAPAGDAPYPALRWAACAGYGIVAAALLAVLPRAGRLVGLRSALANRPAADGGEPWWPLRLLAAALRGTPGRRRTQQEFDDAVSRAVPAARSLLIHRCWPAWLAAFIVPVLGLLSAWEAGKQIEVVAGQSGSDILMQFVPRVSPPMVATIAAALGLMVVLAILDQLTMGLLQRWSTTMTFSDGATPGVAQLLEEPLPTRSIRVEAAAIPDPLRTGTGPAPQAGSPQGTDGPTVADLERMAEEFSSRGRNP
jgi:hypothetical protein